MQDRENGIYDFRYLVTKSGEFKAHVTLASKDVAGSPFDLLFHPGMA